MEAFITLRAFGAESPGEMEHWGLVATEEGGEWEYNQNPLPESFSKGFNLYLAEELQIIPASKPAPQVSYGSTVVVLDELIFRVLEDDIRFEFRLGTGHELDCGKTLCNCRTDAETLRPAERHHTDQRIAVALQRAADALDSRIEWLDVVSPQTLKPLVESAEKGADSGDGTDSE